MSWAAQPFTLPLTWGKGAAERPFPFSLLGVLSLGEIIYALRANKLRPDAAGRPGPPPTARRAENSILHKNDG